MTPEQSALVVRLRDRELNSFGTAAIFERRLSIYKSRLRNLSFVGLVLPLALGGLVIAVGAQWEGLDLIIAITGILAAIQGVANLWALAARWEDRLASSQEAATASASLELSYGRLKESAIAGRLDAQSAELARLDQAYDAQDALDRRQEIEDPERRLGMRKALRQLKRPCGGCGITPVSIENTDCPVCGRLPWEFTWLRR